MRVPRQGDSQEATRRRLYVATPAIQGVEVMRFPWLRPSVFVVSSVVALALACTSTSEQPPSNADSGGGSTSDGGGTGGGGGTKDGGTLEDAATGDDAAPPEPTVTVTNETIMSGGQSREYTLVVPKTYDASKKYPLVLVLHGDGGDGPSFHAYDPYETASGQEALLAFPSGLNAGWDLYTSTASNKDMQFVIALVASLAGSYNIDTSKVFGDGYSSGAYFVSQLSCRKAGFFKGITMHAGGTPDEPNINKPPRDANGCIECDQTGGGPTATLLIQGLSDGTVLPEYGEYAAQCWAAQNGCGSLGSGGGTCNSYAGCAAGKPVEICEVPGLGHVVWSEGAARSWAFFKGVP